MKLSPHLENMNMDKLMELIADPKAQGKLTLGEYIQILELAEKSQRVANNQSGYDELFDQLKKLKNRVATLEGKLERIQKAFGGDEDDD